MNTTHAARVGTFAVALGLVAGSPTVALAEEASSGLELLKPKMAEFIPACIAFLIIWLVLSKLAWPAILKMMEDRENKIQGDLDAAAKARSDADAAKEAYDAKLEEAQLKANEILAEAKRDAEVLRADMLAQAQEDAQAIIAKAHDVIDAERTKAMAELSGEVIDLSVEIASKVIGEGMSVEQQRELAIKYLAEVGSLNDD